AAALTPGDVTDIVLGCTHYELVADRISAAVGRPVVLHGSAGAVAAQTLRRIGATDAPGAVPAGPPAVVLSGRAADTLPREALEYAEARLLFAAVPTR
ncbi:glutamate racemase, partial [Streptomyces sp. SID5473]|nr:glutamate racemase [Streptomyces tsukubensis NRRL18488]MYS64880.1 glutamate racemase [Streptomyces sp. SID5473]